MSESEPVDLGDGFRVEIQPPSALGGIFGRVLRGEGAIGVTMSRSNNAQGRDLVITEARKIAQAEPKRAKLNES